MIHSHYDNLKVARDAPPEVIRAAYRALARLHHPDVNQSADSARIMSIVNVAFDVLSDPERRAQHNEWIAEQEHANASSQRSPNHSGGQPATPESDVTTQDVDGIKSTHPKGKSNLDPIIAITVLIVIIVLVTALLRSRSPARSPPPPIPDLQTYQGSTTQSREEVAAELLRRNPPTPLPIPGGELLFTGAISPALGEIRIELRSNSTSGNNILEGSASRAARYAKQRLCGTAGLIERLGLDSSKIILSIYEGNAPIGEVQLYTTFCK